MQKATRRLFHPAMLLARLGTASVATAQSTPPSDSGQQTDPATTSSAPADFSSLDVDGNGKLDKDEASADAALSAGFDHADSDKDGSVSSTELDQHRQNPSGDADSSSEP